MSSAPPGQAMFSRVPQIAQQKHPILTTILENSQLFFSKKRTPEEIGAWLKEQVSIAKSETLEF